MPGNRIKFGNAFYNGDSDDNIIECSDSRLLKGAVQSGVVMRLDKYIESLEEQGNQKLKEAEAAAEKAKARVDEVKESLKETIAAQKEKLAPFTQTAKPKTAAKSDSK